MLEVLSGFTVVWIIIVLGFFLGRSKLLGENAPIVLSRLAFFVAIPSLLFTTVSKAHVREVLGTPLLVAATSAMITTAVLFFIAKVLMRRGRVESFVTSLAGSLVNATNLGLPISAFVLGDATLIVPTMIFQLAFYTPLSALTLDLMTRGGSWKWWTIPAQILKNPMMLGATAGLLVAAFQWEVPGLIFTPFELLGGAAIPAMLLTFGMSLVGSRPLQREDGFRGDVALATAGKLVLHPGLAFVIAHLVLGISGPLLFAVVISAALPTAQNLLVIAMRYQTGVLIAKDSVLVTTIVAVGTLATIAAVLS